MKRLLVVLVVFAVMAFVGCENWNWGIGTKANALPQTLFNAGVKKQIFYVAGGAVGTYNTSAELTFDGTFLCSMIKPVFSTSPALVMDHLFPSPPKVPSPIKLPSLSHR